MEEFIYQNGKLYKQESIDAILKDLEAQKADKQSEIEQINTDAVKLQSEIDYKNTIKAQKELELVDIQKKIDGIKVVVPVEALPVSEEVIV